MPLSWSTNAFRFSASRIARLLQTFSAIAIRENFCLVGGVSPWVYK